MGKSTVTNILHIGYMKLLKSFVIRFMKNTSEYRIFIMPPKNLLNDGNFHIALVPLMASIYGWNVHETAAPYTSITKNISQLYYRESQMQNTDFFVYWCWWIWASTWCQYISKFYIFYHLLHTNQLEIPEAEKLPHAEENAPELPIVCYK